jgi:hypothetical protein
MSSQFLSTQRGYRSSMSMIAMARELRMWAASQSSSRRGGTKKANGALFALFLFPTAHSCQECT